MPFKGRGKRRGGVRETVPRKRQATEADGARSGSGAAETDDLAGKQKGANPVVDFEAILRASEVVRMPASIINESADNLGCGGTLENLHGAQSATGRNVEAIRCSDDDIFVHVPKSLRQQICKGEYVNVALLLKGGMELSEFCSGGSLKLSADGSIEMKSKICKDKVPSIEKWTDAFLVYASIYMSAHPNKSIELFHYMYLIREAAARQKGFAWRSYDEQFRIRQGTFPASWSAINNDLWWRCMQIKEPSDAPTDIFTQAKLRTCNDFNGGFCRWPSCKYSHSCSGCGASHGAWSCPNKPQTVGSNQTNVSTFRGSFNRSPFRFQRGRGTRGSTSFSRGGGNRQRPF